MCLLFTLCTVGSPFIGTIGSHVDRSTCEPILPILYSRDRVAMCKCQSGLEIVKTTVCMCLLTSLLSLASSIRCYVQYTFGQLFNLMFVSGICNTYIKV